MIKGFSKYVIYQITGWGLFFFINVFFAVTFDRFNLNYIGRLSIFVTLGVIFSHFMRFAIIRSNLLMKALQNQLVGFILITLIFALSVGSLETIISRVFQNRSAREAELSETAVLISNPFFSFIYLF